MGCWYASRAISAHMRRRLCVCTISRRLPQHCQLHYWRTVEPIYPLIVVGNKVRHKGRGASYIGTTGYDEL
jgi:hypothetical protein